MAGPGADELVDSDPLMGFAEESGENLPEITPVVSTDVPKQENRLDRIERTIVSAQQELAQIRSEIATLVGTIEDIKKRANRHSSEPAGQQPRKSWVRVVTATVGVMFGIAIGALVWVQLAGMKTVPVGAAPQEHQQPSSPAESATPPQPEPSPVVAPVAVTVPPARIQQSSTKPSPAKPPSIERAQPVNYVGTLSIDADPAGEVFINRQDAGRTPLRLDNLRAGSHLIWIERDGYQRWTRVVQVQADHVTRLSAELEPTVSR
jgi:uncharacterized coiled-coil protein SlyX